MTHQETPTRLAILGSTGSIGTQALQVIQESPQNFDIRILAAGSNLDAFQKQFKKHSPTHAILVNHDENSSLPKGMTSGKESLHKALEEESIDLVLNGITGFAGLEYSLKSLQSGADLALANKESLVTAGSLLKKVAKENHCQIIPVDSEHNAILQCIHNHPEDAIERILITASGGPFRGWNKSSLQEVTPSQALNHPTWKMGPRISVDSASLFNKAFELIEAVELFGIPTGGIDVLVHPQSVIHAIVEFRDGSSLAHMSEPDMRVPIRHALNRSARAEGNFSPLDLVSRGELTFEALDHDTFPAIRMAQQVLKSPGSTLGAVFNAADEIAVAAFLSGDSGFLSIYDLVDRAIQEHEPVQADSLETILEADLETRNRVRSWIP